MRCFVLRDHLRLEEPEKVYADVLYPIRVGGLWGYMDYQGRTVIVPQYASAGEFRGVGYAEVIPAGSTWRDGGGVIDRQGNWVVPPEYILDLSVRRRGHGGSVAVRAAEHRPGGLFRPAQRVLFRPALCDSIALGQRDGQPDRGVFAGGGGVE